jgi:hypothetical protein
VVPSRKIHNPRRDTTQPQRKIEVANELTQDELDKVSGGGIYYRNVQAVSNMITKYRQASDAVVANIKS